MYDPDDMEQFCDVQAPGLFEDIFSAIFNDEKEAQSRKKEGRKTRKEDKEDIFKEDIFKEFE